MSYKTYTKEESKEQIKKLVSQFDLDFGGKKNPEMKEAQLEDKYLKPFFSYLNWNIHNEGLDKGREEFRVQTSHKMKKTTKEPDYELWLPEKSTNKMKRYLFMEAKNPKYDLQKEVRYMRQAYQYAHSTLNLSDHSFNRTRLSLLTDFEEFRLFDCIDPYPLTKNDAAVFNKYIVSPFDYNYRDYITHFDMIWNAFERNNVLNGSLDEFKVTDKKLKEKRVAPDLRFLDDLKEWRLEFARSMYKSNKEVADDFLTTASQVMINRIIFLKMLTDREIENDYLSMILERIDDDKEEISIYDSCRSIFEELDKKYNGAIFKRREEFDHVKIENKVFRKIIYSLQPEKSVYTLSAMPVEIIGNAYEQFLGEVIIHKGRGLSSEQKPEVQKAGGVFYTPRYIVNYLVEKTVGKKLKKCKTPDAVSKIKVLDPACGSGSFLIGVYSYILNWYMNYYRTQVEKMLKNGKTELDIKNKFRKEIKYYHVDGDSSKQGFILHLTSKLKKSILMNNIYGVDIDENAVEITRFSLSMKSLEDASKDEVYEDVDLFNDKILPNLGSNIKCGNSLIGSDFYEGELLDVEVYKKVNDFDWKEEFETIFTDGGFDCIVGNPPYLRIQGLQEYYANQIEYYINKYESAVKRFDIYLLFLEKGYSLLNKSGLLGYINPHKFTNSDFGSGLRKFLIQNKALSKVISFGNNLVFSQASTYTGLFFLDKNQKNTFLYHEMESSSEDAIEPNLFGLTEKDFSEIDYNHLSKDAWVLTDSMTSQILQKLEIQKSTAKDVFRYISQGVVSTGDDIFYLSGRFEGDYFIGFSDRLQREVKLEANLMKPILKGGDVKKYINIEETYYVIYPHFRNEKNRTKPVEEKSFKINYPLAYEYLKLFKKELTEKKVKYKTNAKYWYSLHRSREMDLFESKKIITPEISLGCNMTLDNENFYHNTKVYSLIPHEEYKEDIKFWLAILNSNLMWFFLKTTGYVLRGGYFTFKTKYIEPFPMPAIDFSDESLKGKHDKIVELITKRMQLQSEFDKCLKDNDKKIIKKVIVTAEKQLNKMVYVLYGLSEEEIEEVEKSSV